MTNQNINIPEGWIATTLGGVLIKALDKVNVSELNRWNYVSTENMLSNMGGITEAATLPTIAVVSKFQKGDILFSNIRTYFKKLWFSNNEGGASNDVLIFRGDEKIIMQNFLYYLLSDNTFFDYTVKTSKGTKMPRGDKDAIAKYPISIPPLPEQKEIADILSSFDNKIELLRRQNETLEKTAQTIFQEWFGRYSIDDELPEGWRVGSLMDIMDFEGGTQPASDKFEDFPTDENIRLVQIRDYDSDNNITYIPNIGNLRYCSERDIMIGRYGAAVGRVLFGLTGAYNVALVKVIPVKDIYTEYLRTYLNSFSFQSRLSGLTGRSAQDGFNKSDFRSFDVVIPKDDIFRKYEEICSDFITKILQNKSQIKSLSKTRDMLLPKLMTEGVKTFNS